MQRSIIMTALALGAMALSMAGCSKSGETKASQVAVKVNGDEISIHQVNAVLARMPSTGLSDAQQQQARKQTVDGLVEQQLLVQQAIDKKLDRDPEVVQALDASRRQILASAYLQHTFSAQVRPSDAEIQRYYDENPALFSDRRVYQLQQLVATLTPAQRTALDDVVAKAKTMNEVAQWLRAEKINATGDVGVRAAETLPLDTLPRLAKMKDGEIGLFPGVNGATTIVQVVTAQPQPLALNQARPAIEQFLAVRKRDELAAAEVKRLHDAAKITYVGEFQKLATIEIPAPATPQATSQATSQTMAAPTATPTAALDKGLSGLK